MFTTFLEIHYHSLVLHPPCFASFAFGQRMREVGGFSKLRNKEPIKNIFIEKLD